MSTYQELKQQDWLELDSLLRLIVGNDPYELKKARERIRYHKTKYGLHIKTVQVHPSSRSGKRGRTKKTQYIKSDSFFDWASEQWPLARKKLKIPQFVTSEDTAIFKDTSSTLRLSNNVEELREICLGLWQENDKLEQENTELKRLIAELEPDAIAFRKSQEKRRTSAREAWRKVKNRKT